MNLLSTARTMGKQRNTPLLIIGSGIVKLRAKTPGNLGHLHVSIVEPTGTHMTVIYHPPPNHEDTEVQVPFDPPLKSIYEVKPLFRKWEAEVKEKYKPVS